MSHDVGTEFLRALEHRLVWFIMCLLYLGSIVQCFVGLRWITVDQYQFVVVPRSNWSVRRITHRGRITG